MDLNGKLVAVTGATGFLGSHIALTLLSRNMRARAVVRSVKKAQWLIERGVEVACADLHDVDSLCRGFAGCEAVVANAAFLARNGGNLDEFVAGNVGGTENLMIAALRAGVRRVVYISSVAVYKTSLFADMDEETPQHRELRRPLDLSGLITNWRYAVTKARGEQVAWKMAEEHNIDLTVLRPGPIYGERDRALTARYQKAMTRSVQLVPTIKVPHVHGADVAAAVAGALANDGSVGRAYNVTGEPVSPWRVLRKWKQLRSSRTLLLPLFLPVGAKYDDSAAKRDLGFKPRSIERGLEGLLLPENPDAPL